MLNGNLGLHVFKNPAGTFSYVGSIPKSLAQLVPASDSDVMGGRAFSDDVGNILTYKFPTFKTREAAINFAETHGFSVMED